MFLLIVNGNRRCLLVNRHWQVVLHWISFKNTVKAVAFNPCRSHIAVAAGKLLQIWLAPGFKEFFPFELIRTFVDFNDKVTAPKWSLDSKYILAGKFNEMGGENSEPDSPGMLEREVETESGNGVSVKNKKRKGLDGNLENGGKWRLSRKDGFGQGPGGV